MHWQIIVALIIAVPVVLLPVAFVWYLNIGGIYAMVKERRASKSLQKNAVQQEKVKKRTW